MTDTVAVCCEPAVAVVENAPVIASWKLFGEVVCRVRDVPAEFESEPEVPVINTE